jgi:hypothetical protein
VEHRTPLPKVTLPALLQGQVFWENLRVFGRT